MKAVIYLRQSLDKTGEALGVERQEAECRRLCRERGYKVAQVVTDNSVSATKGERAGYKQVLALIEGRKVDVVVVLKVDRLLRKLSDLEQLIELVERTGIPIATVQGDLDLSTSSGRLVGRLLASVARAEVETMGERRRLANAQRAAQGKPYGTGRVYGYEPDGITVREAEAKVLREMAKRVIAGRSYIEVAKWANREGHVTARGGVWRSVTVRNRLLKKRYAGIREYRDVEYEGVWQPIFDRETWDRLQLTIRMRSERVSFVPRARNYLLTGLLVCGKCGSHMIGAQTSDGGRSAKRRTYSCVDNKHLSRNAVALEHFITESVFYRLDTPDLKKLIAAGPDDQYLRDLLADREAQQQRLNGLVDDYSSRLLNKQQFARAKGTAEAELKRIEEEIDRLQSERSGHELLNAGESVRQAWARNELSWRRSLLNLLIKSVTAEAGMSMPYYEVNGHRHRFDPSLIQIEWRA